MLDRFTQRIKAKFISEKEARERLDNLRVELNRVIEFKISWVNEDGGYYLAKSINFPQGLIVTSAKTEDELDKKIKDAIFTAFDIPSQYCDPQIIGKVGEEKKVMYATR